MKNKYNIPFYENKIKANYDNCIDIFDYTTFGYKQYERYINNRRYGIILIKR